MNSPVGAILLAVAGAVIGSFIGVVAERWPRGENFRRGRSRCEGCGRQLSAWEMVPVLSWLWLRGACRTCGVRISPLLPLLEAGGAAIGAVIGAVAVGPLDLLWAVFGWVLMCLAALDYRALWLPDRLTLPLLAAGLLTGVAKGEAALALCGAAMGWALLVLVGGIYERVRGRRGLGGGDPKLLAAIGAWLGPGALPLVILAASIIGLMAVLAMRMSGREIGWRARVPFGTLMALGTVQAMLSAAMAGAPAFSIPV